MAPHRRGRGPCQVVIAILAMSALAAGGRLASPPEDLSVEQLEASLIVTFARFVEWPPDEFPTATAPIVVGVVADQGVALALETVARGKNVAGRTIAVKRPQWDSDLAGVHLLFVGEAEKRHLRVVLERVRSRPVVTVSSLSGFGRAGGMITLALVDKRISFSVNSHATTVSGVRLSSFLLSHAAKVSDESGGGVR